MRPLSVTGAFLENGIDLIFHQMTLDRIENGEYVLHNTFFDDDSETNVSNDTAVSVLNLKTIRIIRLRILYFKTELVIRIRQTKPYYAYDSFISQNGGTYYNDGKMKMSLVNEIVGNMNPNTWYLLPQAYSLKLTKTIIPFSAKKSIP